MYEEKKGFSFRDAIVQLLLVVLFVFILIWLFPTKGYLADKFATKDYVDNALSEKLKVLYGRVYADNVETMKEAATSYYTTSRLPKNVGDSVSITLEEMLDKKMLLDFTDSNGKECDITNSYVKVTKMDDEYEMKVQLSCSDYSDYVIVYMGCYNYCDSAICQAKTTTNTSTTKTTTKKTDPTPVVAKQYNYEYRKVTQNEYSDWGNWSNWSTTAVSSNNLTEVDMKTEKVITGYRTETGIINYDTDYYTTYELKTVYSTKDVVVQDGTKQVANTTTDTKTPTKSTSSSYWTDWAYQGIITVNYHLSTSSSVYLNSTTKAKYAYVSTAYKSTCNGCSSEFIYTYKKWTSSYVSGKTSVTCPTGYTLNSAKTLCTKTSTTYTTVPVYKTVTQQVATVVKVPVTKSTTSPVYGTVQGDPIYSTVTYYRYRTRTLVKQAGVDYKWSSSDNDTSLTNQGYVLTGNKKEV